MFMFHQPSRGSASDAVTLRISDTMTKSQLQEECKLRGIKGHSGKNKEWLLEQLHVGSVWLAMADSTGKSQSKPKAKCARKAQATKSKPRKSTQPKKRAAVPKAACNTKAKANGTIDCSLMPKVTPDLSKTQLMHELLRRKPQIQGASSGKPKSWFIFQLGEQSIWTTAPNLINRDLSNLPLVTPGLTKTQLTHELMSRATATNASPSLTEGLTTKTKSELLKLVVVGSIWTTGVARAASEKTAAKKPAKRKAAPAPQRKSKSSLPKTKTARGRSSGRGPAAENDDMEKHFQTMNDKWKQPDYQTETYAEYPESEPEQLDGHGRDDSDEEDSDEYDNPYGSYDRGESDREESDQEDSDEGGGNSRVESDQEESDQEESDGCDGYGQEDSDERFKLSIYRVILFQDK